MTLDERLAFAKDLRSQGMNCSQCVAMAFYDEVDAHPELLKRMATGFGGGMGGAGEVCGAVSAMTLITGMRGDGNKKETYPVVNALVRDFSASHGGKVLCRDLKGNCWQLIEDAITQLHNSLERH